MCIIIGLGCQCLPITLAMEPSRLHRPISCRFPFLVCFPRCKSFIQLYTIFSRNEGGLVLPAVFSFLPRKSMEWYRLMWEVIFEQVLSRQICYELRREISQMGSFTGPDSFIMDFELAVRNRFVQFMLEILICYKSKIAV